MRSITNKTVYKKPENYNVGVGHAEDDSKPILRPQSKLIRETQMTRRRRGEMSKVTSVARISHQITREKDKVDDNKLVEE